MLTNKLARINKDVASLESIYKNMEASLQFGGLDKPSLRIVNVVQNHMSKRYNLDNIVISNESNTLTPTEVSMETVKGMLKKVGAGAVKVAKYIWEKIMKFIKWVTNIIPLRKERIKKQQEKLDAYNKALNETAKLIKNGKLPPQYRVNDNDEMIILVKPNGAKDVVIPDLVDGPANAAADSGDQGNQVPKTKVLKAEQELNQDVVKKTIDTDLSSYLGDMGKNLDSTKMVQYIYELNKLNNFAAIKAHRCLDLILETLNKLKTDSDIVLMSDTVIHQDISSVRQVISTSFKGMWIRGDADYSFPGIINNMEGLAVNDDTTPHTYFNAIDLDFRFDPPEAGESYELQTLSSKQISRIRADQLSCLSDESSLAKKYSNVLLDVQKAIMTIESNRMSRQDDMGVNWLREWTFKMAGIMMACRGYTSHYNRLVEKYIADSIKAIGE